MRMTYLDANRVRAGLTGTRRDSQPLTTPPLQTWWFCRDEDRFAGGSVTRAGFLLAGGRFAGIRECTE
jgi:hypothetical protein